MNALLGTVLHSARHLGEASSVSATYDRPAAALAVQQSVSEPGRRRPPETPYMRQAPTSRMRDREQGCWGLGGPDQLRRARHDDISTPARSSELNASLAGPA